MLILRAELKIWNDQGERKGEEKKLYAKMVHELEEKVDWNLWWRCRKKMEEKDQ